MAGKKSPLKVRPRRVAGQSVQEQLDKIKDEFFEKGMLIALAVALMSGEFTHWWLNSPPNPLIMAVVCVPFCGYLVYQLIKLRSQFKNLEQGKDGEKIVAEQLEGLRVHGYQVFHDLIGNRFNLDHVLVGPAGVFTVETKTWSKATSEQIKTDGKVIWKGDYEIKPSPFEQAESQARWLHGVIKELTGQNVFVQSMIVFPGWWVERKPGEFPTLVLNPREIEGCLKSLSVQLKGEDIVLIANRLELFARAKGSVGSS